MPRQDDVDDFMASILGGQPAAQPKPKQPIFAKKQTPRPAAAPPARRESAAQQPARHATEQGRTSRRLPRVLVFLPLLAATIAGGYFLWRGPVSNLLEPPSPFSAEVRQQMGIPLYFPTKLPPGFKIETGSITQQGSDVILYAITNDSGQRINITLQKKPAGINLDPLYAALSNLKEIETKQFGKVKTGISAEGAQITNILTDKTWVIINYNKDTIDDTQLTDLINSLRQ